MFDFLYHISDTQVFIFLMVVTIFFSVGLIVLNKFFIFVKFKYRDNATTASVGSLLGIIYGVLAGFICLYLIGNHDQATQAALNEGVAAASVYTDSKWLAHPLQDQIQSDIRHYVDQTINVEWPHMNKGIPVARNDSYLISKMSDELRAAVTHASSDNSNINVLRQDLKDLYHARLERIEMSEAQLSPEIWEVIVMSTILIIVINYAFRVNFYLHLFSITAFAIMASSILFLLVTLDRPFQGEFIVYPDAMQAVLDLMAHDKKG